MLTFYELWFPYDKGTRKVKCTFEHELNDRQQNLLKDLVREEIRKTRKPIDKSTFLMDLVSNALCHFNEKEGMFGKVYLGPACKILVV